MIEYVLIIGLTCFIAGVAILCIIKWKSLAMKIRAADVRASLILQDAKRKSETIIKEAGLESKSKLFKMKTELDDEIKVDRNELKKREQRLIKKEEILELKVNSQERKDIELSGKEGRLAKIEKNVKHCEKKYHDLIEEQKRQLEKVSSLTADQAKALLLKAMENEARHEGARLIKRIENEAIENADRKSKDIIATAIQRYAGDCIAERAVSVVQLPNDDMKGRIIGREGRNIRALEAATGIDIIIDDTPEAVIMSGFNPVRREVARLSLIKLISDGRIHPARIEDVVKKVGKEVDATIKEVGEQAVFDLGVHGVHPDIIKHIGSLKFRTSYAQNVLQHSVEVGFLCGVMAAELNLNQKLARRIGLLHDIGKAVDHEVEGSHAIIGSRIANKLGECEDVVHAIAAHHEDVAPNSVYALLVQAADSLSGARPGARKELLESYIKRLENLEKIAKSFKGVANTYAIQAGRELRVIVESGIVSDEESTLLSRDIVKKVEQELTFPGQIKITVIRETRSVEYANK